MTFVTPLHFVKWTWHSQRQGRCMHMKRGGTTNVCHRTVAVLLISCIHILYACALRILFPHFKYYVLFPYHREFRCVGIHRFLVGLDQIRTLECISYNAIGLIVGNACLGAHCNVAPVVVGAIPFEIQ